MCFLLKEEPSLFAGDSVLGFGTAWFEHLDDYMASLRLMKTVVQNAGQHFQVCNRSLSRVACLSLAIPHSSTRCCGSLPSLLYGFVPRTAVVP